MLCTCHTPAPVAAGDAQTQSRWVAIDVADDIVAVAVVVNVVNVDVDIFDIADDVIVFHCVSPCLPMVCIF